MSLSFIGAWSLYTYINFIDVSSF